MDNLEKALNEAYEYVGRVIFKQKRALFSDDMYKGYSSMGFKPTLNKRVFTDFYNEIIQSCVENSVLIKK